MIRRAVSCAVVVAGVALGVSGCDSGSPTAPQRQTSSEVSGTIAFSTAGPANAPISSHSESGFVVQFRSGSWQVWTVYGNPAPFPVFSSPGGTSTPAEIHITAGGSVFSFRSVDLYSSTTQIPYVIVGTRAGVKEVEFGATLPAAGVVGNTFGAFRTVTNPTTGRLIDALTLTLINPAAPCCDNPMGLDNIVLSR
jgi:hypothetical protein